MGKKKPRLKKKRARPRAKPVPLHIQIEERYDRQSAWAGYFSDMSYLREEVARDEMAASMRHERRSEREISQALAARGKGKGSGYFVGF